MAVHAHPDDEASKGAATTARYAAEGNEVMVVTLTGGERGDILNPAMDRPEVAANIGAIRREEMAKAAAELGVRHRWLGYVDSGLPQGDPLPPLPSDSFALVPIEEPIAKLVAVVREFRPHVMTTYDENGGYPHPDHIRCHEVSMAAFEAAADPEQFPEAGEPWTVSKIYYNHGFMRARMQLLNDECKKHGYKGPFDEWLERWPADDDTFDRRVTTRCRAQISSMPATRRCVRMRRKSRPTAAFSRSHASSSGNCGPPRTSSWRSHACRRARPRMICSQELKPNDVDGRRAGARRREESDQYRTGLR